MKTAYRLISLLLVLLVIVSCGATEAPPATEPPAPEPTKAEAEPTKAPEPEPTKEEAAPAEGEGEAAAVEGEPASAFDSIILIVTPQDAAVLKYVLENRFIVDLVLRSREDRDPHKTEQVTLEYIMARFGISPPAKLPYTLKNASEVTPISPPPPPPE